MLKLKPESIGNNDQKVAGFNGVSKLGAVRRSVGQILRSAYGLRRLAYGLWLRNTVPKRPGMKPFCIVWAAYAASGHPHRTPGRSLVAANETDPAGEDVPARSAGCASRGFEIQRPTRDQKVGIMGR
jgi:hypothetical protein